MNNSELLIRKATQKDLDSVMAIIRSCTEHMISKNIFQWNEKYPNIETFQADINNEHLYVLANKDKELIGCVSITFEMDDFYKKIDWISSSNKNIYVHRLAVHPNYQGQGHAKTIMNWIENKAIEAKCESRVNINITKQV